MDLLNDMKSKVTHLMETYYGFDTSRAPESIGRNASRAHTLLTRMTFIYHVCLITLQLGHTDLRTPTGL
jgi:hypothetical protein